MTNKQKREILVRIDLPPPAIDEAKLTNTRVVAITVKSARDREEVVAFMQRVKATRDALEAQRVELKAPALAAGKEVDEFFREPLRLLDEALKLGRPKVIEFDNEQKRLAEEERQRIAQEQRKAREEADRLEREALRKAQEEADAKRAAEEAAAAAEAARLAAAEAAEAGDEAAQAEAEAEARAARVAEVAAARAKILAGQKSAQLTTEARQVIEAVPTALTTRVSTTGTSTRKRWKFRITNGDLIPRKFLQLNEQLIQQHVNSFKEATAIEGVEVYAEDELAIRGGR